MLKFIVSGFGFLLSLDICVISPSLPTDDWLNSKEENKYQLNKIKELLIEKRSTFLLSLIWVLYKKNEWESYLIALSSRRNKCQVATILLNFSFLYIEWVKITQFVHLLQVTLVGLRDAVSLPSHCCRIYQSSIDGSSEDFWWKHLYCWEFMDVALHCLKMYTLNEFW